MRTHPAPVQGLRSDSVGQEWTYQTPDLSGRVDGMWTGWS